MARRLTRRARQEVARAMADKFEMDVPGSGTREMVSLRTPSGVAVVPADAPAMIEAVMLDKAKEGLLARVGAKVASWFRPRTSDSLEDATSSLADSAQGARAGLAGGLVGSYYDAMRLESIRLSKYRDYERMHAECVELRRSLEVTVANVFMSRDGDQESYQVKSKNARVERLLRDVDKRTQLPQELPEVCQSGLKFGDDFEEIVVDQGGRSVLRLNWLNQKQMERNDDRGMLPREGAFTMKSLGAQAGVSGGDVRFAAWQVIHFRHAHERGDRYGTSFYDPCRKAFRQFDAAENGMLVGLLTRAADQVVYLIPAPKGVHPDEARRLLDETKKELKRRSIVDPETGKLDLRKSPMTDNEDLFVLTTKDNPADVKRLAASNIGAQLPVVEHFQNKTFTATGVPKSYLGLERDVNAKATLSNQDIEFARRLRSIQREVAQVPRAVYDLQLLLVGIVPEDGLYEVIFPAISLVDEEMKASVEQIRWAIAGSARQTLQIPVRWLLANVIKLPEEQVEKVALEMDKEKEAFDAAAQQWPQQGGGWGGRGYNGEQVLERVRRDRKLAQVIEEFRAAAALVRRYRLDKPLVVSQTEQ